MAYIRPATTVTVGITMALLTYGAATSTVDATVFLLAGSAFVVGVFLAVLGLFGGIEAAVAAGTDRPSTAEDVE